MRPVNAILPKEVCPVTHEPTLRAIDFESRRVYQSRQRPSYTSWVSFFRGGDGRWYLTCEEVTRPQTPLPQCSAESWHAMSLPAGYDKSQHRMEAVILASDDLAAWEEVSRAPLRFHHSAGQFGTARTPDGRFHRFVWACYAIDGALAPNEVYFTSDDGGGTWDKQPPFHSPRFASYPHRLRTLRDGTMVLCLQLAPLWGTPERPVRASTDLDAVGEGQMTLMLSFDQGRSWQGPIPVLGGQTVSEADVVELPSGDLVLVNNSIFRQPGRQVLYRDGERPPPAPLGAARGRTGRDEPNLVPETACRTADGLFVGCMRPGRYQWSADEGRTWYPLADVPDVGRQVYQPWIHCLDDGRLACAGHFGRDAPIRGAGVDDQYLSLHLFRVSGATPGQATRLQIAREHDPGARRWRNRFRATLLARHHPVPRPRPSARGARPPPLEPHPASP